jgi:hypothetical protein
MKMKSFNFDFPQYLLIFIRSLVKSSSIPNVNSSIILINTGDGCIT